MLGPKLGCEMAGQLDERRLGGAIVKRACLFGPRIYLRIGRDQSIHRGDIDDAGPAYLFHGIAKRGQRSTHDLERRRHARTKRAFEIFRLKRVARFRRHADRIVYDHIDALAFRKECAHGIEIGHIECGAFGRRKLAREILELSRIAAIEDHMRARLVHRTRHRAS